MHDGKDRIRGDMTTIDVFMSLSEGNPGAVRVLSEAFKNGDRIDPDSVFGGFGALLMFDSFRFYGSKIWMLYKDLCGQDIVKTIGMLRAMQLNLVSSADVHRAIGDDRTPGVQGLVDVDALVAQVKERLPKFGGAQ
jgi:hypothetical protein